jgi:hypothetical protein
MVGWYTEFGRVLWTTQHSLRASKSSASTATKSSAQDDFSRELTDLVGAAATSSSTELSHKSAKRNAA